MEVHEDDFDDIRLLEDGEGFTFALVPVGEDPPPPGPEVVASLVGVGTEIQWETTDPLTDDTQGDGSQGDGSQGDTGVETSDGSDG